MSPAAFQAAQVAAKRKGKEELEARPAKRQRIKRYRAKDFQTPFATPREVEEWFAEYPAVRPRLALRTLFQLILSVRQLSQRNFYIVQNHWATRDHYDLRVQLDGRTTSWAIPATLADPTKQLRRQAIETNPHPISYSLFEGRDPKGPNITGVWDIGTYKVRSSRVPYDSPRAYSVRNRRSTSRCAPNVKMRRPARKASMMRRRPTKMQRRSRKTTFKSTCSAMVRLTRASRYALTEQN